MKTLYSLNKITEMFEADRAVMLRAMRTVKKPDGYEGRQPRYTLKTAVNALVAHKVGVATQQKPGKQVDERQSLLKEQRLQKQRENALADGELLSAVEVERAWSAVFRVARAGMLTVVPRAAQRCPHLTRQDVSELDYEVREVLKEIGTDENSQVRDALGSKKAA